MANSLRHRVLCNESLISYCRFLEEKEDHIVELEGQVAEMGELQGDKAELLENIQSDKTALSRALTQNKDLKTQLAELQNGFVKLVGLGFKTWFQSKVNCVITLEAKALQVYGPHPLGAAEIGAVGWAAGVLHGTEPSQAHLCGPDITEMLLE